MKIATVLRFARHWVGLVILGTTGFGCSPAEPPRNKPSGFPVSVNTPIDTTLVGAAKSTLLELAKSAEPGDRAHAIEGLRDGLAPEAGPVVLAGLEDRNQIVRFAAAFAVGELKLADARPPLIQHLKDSDPRVRVAVRFALHKLGDISHTGDLEGYAQNLDAKQGQYVRGATAFVLGRLGESSAAGVLRLLRIDDSAVVRLQAEESLFLLGDSRAEKAIAALTVSKFPDDQMLGLRAMTERADPRFRSFARAQLTYDYPEVALVAAMALGAMDADDGFGVAIKGIKTTPSANTPEAIAAAERQRALAAAAMGWIGRPDAQPLLKEAIKDPAADVRASAATAILRIGNKPKLYTRAGELIKPTENP